MHPIPLLFHALDYTTDAGTTLRAWRVRVEVEFVRQGGLHVPHRCLFDSGSPFSVIPYSLWHAQKLEWTPLGTQLTETVSGLSDRDASLWMGMPCTLGETTVFLVDVAARIRTGPHRLLAKFVQKRFPRRLSKLETMRIVGLNFLAENGIGLRWVSTSGGLTGLLVVP